MSVLEIRLFSGIFLGKQYLRWFSWHSHRPLGCMVIYFFKLHRYVVSNIGHYPSISKNILRFILRFSIEMKLLSDNADFQKNVVEMM